MSLQTKIKKTVFEKKLRARLKKLQSEREKNLEKFDQELIAWKKRLLQWFFKEGGQRVVAITKSEVKDGERYNGQDYPGIDYRKLFRGAPMPPSYPGIQQIRDIRNTLRHLSLVSSTELTLYTNEVTKLLGDPEDQEKR